MNEMRKTKLKIETKGQNKYEQMNRERFLFIIMIGGLKTSSEISLRHARDGWKYVFTMCIIQGIIKTYL